jgi:hypothetical protein
VLDGTLLGFIVKYKFFDISLRLQGAYHLVVAFNLNLKKASFRETIT